MRSGIVGSLLILLASTGSALAQTAPAARPAGSPPPVQPAAAEQHLPPAETQTTPPPHPTDDVLLPPPAGTELWSDSCQPTCAEACSPLKQCLPEGFVWFSTEFLLFFQKGQSSPPLVTTGPATVPPAQFGVLGVPGTTTLFGGDIHYGAADGLRLSGGVVGPDHSLGIEGNVFLLERRSAGIHTVSDPAGNPIVARPFTDALDVVNSRLLTSGPGVFTGELIAETTNRLFGGEANITKAVFGLIGCDSTLEIDLFAGFRYLDLAETLTFAQLSTILPGGNSSFNGMILLAPTQVAVSDGFLTRNQFYAPQLGASTEWQFCHLFIDLAGKVALGDDHETITINGATAMTPRGGPTTITSGGLQALPTNIGQMKHDDFAAVTEVDFNIGYQFLTNFRFYAGYSYLFWSSVVRPGNQINSPINVAQLPTSPAFAPGTGPTLPAPGIHRDSYWAHGLNIGLAVHY